VADNVLGGGDDINLGLNVNLGLDKSIQDASTLANQIKDMRQDQEAFVNSVSDSQEKLSLITSELSKQLDFKQQMITAEQELKAISESQKQNAQDMLSSYRELNNVVNNLALNMSRINGTPIDISRMGGSNGQGMGQDQGQPVRQQDLYGPNGEAINRGGNNQGGNNRRDRDIDLREFPDQGQQRGPNSQSEDEFLQNARILRDKGIIMSTSGRSVVDDYGNQVEQETETAGVQTAEQASASQAKLSQLLPTYGSGARYSRMLRYYTGMGVGENLINSQLSKGLAGEGIVGSIARMGGYQPNYNISPVTGLPESPQSMGGMMQGLGKAGAVASLAAQGVQAAYGMYAGAVQEGQLYTGLTGGTGIAGALGQDLGAQITSLGGLNPLESYGTAKQIRMNALGMGYGQNTGLFNNAVDFGNAAAQKYGMDPNQSMTMFNQSVVQAGSSALALQSALDNLGKVASTSSTSFQGMLQSFNQYSQMGASMGMMGTANTAFAQGASTFAAGSPALQQSGANPANLMNSMIGQALIAQQMGTSYMNLPAVAANSSASSLAGGVNMAAEQLLGYAGINKSNYKDKATVEGNFRRAQMIFASAGDTSLNGMSMTAFLEYVTKTFDGSLVKGAQNAQNEQVDAALGTNSLNARTNGSAIAAGVGKTGLAKTIAEASTVGPYGTNSIVEGDIVNAAKNAKWNNVGIEMNGKFMSLGDIEKLPAAQRQKIDAAISTGLIPLANADSHGKIIAGNDYNSTLLDKMGHANIQNTTLNSKEQQLDALNRSQGLTAQQSQQAIKIEMGMNAQKLFAIIDSPQSFEKWLNNSKKGQGLPPS